MSGREGGRERESSDARAAFQFPPNHFIKHKKTTTTERKKGRQKKGNWLGGELEEKLGKMRFVLFNKEERVERDSLKFGSLKGLFGRGKLKLGFENRLSSFSFSEHRFNSRQRFSKDKSAGNNKGASAGAKMENGGWSGDTARERERERDSGAAREDLETESEIEIGKGRRGRHAYARSVSHRGRKSSRIT